MTAGKDNTFPWMPAARNTGRLRAPAGTAICRDRGSFSFVFLFRLLGQQRRSTSFWRTCGTFSRCDPCNSLGDLFRTATDRHTAPDPNRLVAVSNQHRGAIMSAVVGEQPAS